MNIETLDLFDEANAKTVWTDTINNYIDRNLANINRDFPSNINLRSQPYSYQTRGGCPTGNTCCSQLEERIFDSLNYNRQGFILSFNIFKVNIEDNYVTVTVKSV